MTSSSSSASYVLAHNLTLTSLITSTEYFYNITSCTFLDVCNEMGPYSFIAASQDQGELIMVSAPGFNLTWVILLFGLASILFILKK